MMGGGRRTVSRGSVTAWRLPPQRTTMEERQRGGGGNRLSAHTPLGVRGQCWVAPLATGRKDATSRIPVTGPGGPRAPTGPQGLSSRE